MRPVRRLSRCSDAELITRSRSSAPAFRVLCERHAGSVQRFLIGRTGDPEIARDLTAETLARAWLSRERFADKAGGSALPWLLGIARNVVADSVRKRRLESEAIQRLGLSLGSEARWAEIDERWLDGLDEELARALDELSADQRDAVWLRVVDEHGYDELASTLGCTREAARVRVFRGLERLRARFPGRPTSSP